MKNKMNKISEKVYNFKTKYSEGFTNSEIDLLLKDFPTVDMKKFNDGMMCNTCMIIDEELIQYHCDIAAAIRYSI